MITEDPFTTLLLEHLPGLRAYALVMTRNSSAADDLLQETSYRALRSHAQFTIGTNFTSWVYRILRNTFITSLRRAKRTPLSIDDLPESVFSKHADQEEIVLSREISRAMSRLRPKHRQVMALVCERGMTYTEAAIELRCTVATVKSRLWRARQRMASFIQGNARAARQFSVGPDSISNTMKTLPVHKRTVERRADEHHAANG